MPPTSVPSQCAVALKEWATVLEAMGRGEQLVLIRKGGLIEPASGFDLIANTFVLYPTFEHQAVQYLRPPYQRYLEDAMSARAPAGQLRVDLYGIAVSSTQTHDLQLIERLSAFHIYQDTFLTQRLKWQPEQPLVVVVVRAFRFATPRLLPVVPRYAGCKSWVDLESSVALEGASPVVDDSTFQQRAQAIASILA